MVIFEIDSEISIDYTDDETPVNRIMGLFEPDPFKENVYIQTKPMYKENPFVILLTNELSFVFVKSSIYNDKQFNMASYNFQFQVSLCLNKFQFKFFLKNSVADSLSFI